MPEQDYAEDLNRIIDAIIADPRAAVYSEGGAELASLARIASELRGLPREDFKELLKSEFEGRKPMSSVAKPVAEVRATASPRMTFKDAAKAIEFYQRAFGAPETFRFEAGGPSAHAELAIGDSILCLAEEWPDAPRRGRDRLGTS